jgi:chromosome segregation ATPase
MEDHPGVLYLHVGSLAENDLNKVSATQQEIQFKAYYLLKDEESYQFCYVDEDGLVRGTSVPFQFCPDPDEDIKVVINKERVEGMEQLSEELYQENLELKDKYTDLHEQLQRKRMVLEATQRMKKTLEQEVKEKASWEEEKGSWESELLKLKESIQQKIMSEKDLGIRIEELQTQLATQEKEMEDLIVKDQEKTEQLEQLKKENGQLSLSLTEQKQHWKTLGQTVEMLKEKEAAAWKKQQG